MAEFVKVSKQRFPNLEESVKMDKLCSVVSIFRREVDEKRAVLKLCCVHLDELLKFSYSIKLAKFVKMEHLLCTDLVECVKMHQVSYIARREFLKLTKYRLLTEKNL
jgi:hypothetical protein